MKRKKIGLTERKGAGQFSKDIGKYVSDHGKVQYRRWYLGDDRTEAERLAKMIVNEWKNIRLAGGSVWTADAIQRIALHRAGVDAVAAPVSEPPAERSGATPSTALAPDRLAGGGRMIYSVMDEYDQNLEQLADSKQVSQGHRQSQQACLRRLRKYMADMPMGALTYGMLLNLCNTFAARPKSERGEPMAVVTVVNTVNAIKLFLGHCEDSGEWKPTYNWRRALRLKRRNLTTDEEKEKTKKTPIFEPADLRHIWNRAPERARLYMLLGLNCGATQVEISTLRLTHVHLDDATPYIERPRNKTGVDGRWPLWPETVVLLQKYLAPNDKKRNPDGRALLNENGEQIVRYASKGRADSVTAGWQRCVYDSQKWYRWRKQKQYKVVGEPADAINPEGAPEPPTFQRLPFKYLRKTGYSWVKIHFSTETAEWYSSHAEHGQIGAYSDAVWGLVATAVMAMRDDLGATMFRDMPNPLRLSLAEMAVEIAAGRAPGPSGSKSAERNVA
jgi:integrase